jgi:hypothetical protein
LTSRRDGHLIQCLRRCGSNWSSWRLSWRRQREKKIEGMGNELRFEGKPDLGTRDENLL